MICQFQLRATFGKHHSSQLISQVYRILIQVSDPTLHTRIPRALHLSFSGVVVRRLEQMELNAIQDYKWDSNHQGIVQWCGYSSRDSTTHDGVCSNFPHLPLPLLFGGSLRAGFNELYTIWGKSANNFIWLISALFGTEVCLFILRYISFVWCCGLLGIFSNGGLFQLSTLVIYWRKQTLGPRAQAPENADCWIWWFLLEHKCDTSSIKDLFSILGIIPTQWATINHLLKTHHRHAITASDGRGGYCHIKREIAAVISLDDELWQ